MAWLGLWIRIRRRTSAHARSRAGDDYAIMDRLNSSRRGFTLLELMLVIFISSFVFAGVLSAYIFLGRALARQVNEMDLESRTRTTLSYFRSDVSGASNIEPLGALASPTITANPSSLQFTVDTVIPLAAGGSVTGTATYTYTAPTTTVAGTLKVVREPPSGVAASTLQTPSWATDAYGASSPTGKILLNNLVSLSFVYYSGITESISSSTTFNYVASPGTYTVTVSSGSPIDQLIPASNVIDIKYIALNFVVAEPFSKGPAYTTLTLSSGPVMLKNKGVPQ